MEKSTQRVNVRRRLSEGLKALRRGRSLSVRRAGKLLGRAGLELTSEEIEKLERGEGVLKWTDFLAVLRGLQCSLSGFEQAMEGEVPVRRGGPPPLWASRRLLGIALGALREREALEPSLLAKRMSVRMTVAKIERWERGELPITLVRLLMLLNTMELDLEALELELERQAKGLAG